MYSKFLELSQSIEKWLENYVNRAEKSDRWLYVKSEKKDYQESVSFCWNYRILMLQNY